MKKLFDYNITQDIKSSTSLMDGESIGIINTNKLTYPWAYNIWKVMISNTWFVEEVDFTQDNYKELLPAEKRMYDLILSQLIFMDSVQVNNLMDNVNCLITDPMVNACISRVAFEEA